MTVGSQAGMEYQIEIEHWRQGMETQLRAPDGWLSVAGLDWLSEGENSIGSDAASNVLLPAPAPAHLGTITLNQQTITLTTHIPVLVDGVETQAATLRDDHDSEGASLVRIGDITFNVIRRGKEFGVRMRDANNPARATFAGRAWYPIRDQYRVRGVFTPHSSERILEVENSLGKSTEMVNPGCVDFELNGQPIRLEAFEASHNQLWFIFRDSTSGKTSYPAGRFLYAPLHTDGTVDLDFNKAYHPPCAFTAYATCPFPPKQNILSIPIEAGERYAEGDTKTP